MTGGELELSKTVEITYLVMEEALLIILPRKEVHEPLYHHQRIQEALRLLLDGMNAVRQNGMLEF